MSEPVGASGNEKTTPAPRVVYPPPQRAASGQIWSELPVPSIGEEGYIARQYTDDELFNQGYSMSPYIHKLLTNEKTGLLDLPSVEIDRKDSGDQRTKREKRNEYFSRLADRFNSQNYFLTAGVSARGQPVGPIHRVDGKDMRLVDQDRLEDERKLSAEKAGWAESGAARNLKMREAALVQQKNDMIMEHLRGLAENLRALNKQAADNRLFLNMTDQQAHIQVKGMLLQLQKKLPYLKQLQIDQEALDVWRQTLDEAHDILERDGLQAAITFLSRDVPNLLVALLDWATKESVTKNAAKGFPGNTSGGGAVPR